MFQRVAQSEAVHFLARLFLVLISLCPTFNSAREKKREAIGAMRLLSLLVKEHVCVRVPLREKDAHPRFACLCALCTVDSKRIVYHNPTSPYTTCPRELLQTARTVTWAAWDESSSRKANHINPEGKNQSGCRSPVVDRFLSLLHCTGHAKQLHLSVVFLA